MLLYVCVCACVCVCVCVFVCVCVRAPVYYVSLLVALGNETDKTLV